MRKAFDKQVKEKESALNKEAVDKIQQHFKGDEKSYIAVLDVKGNAKVSHLPECWKPH